MQRQELHQTPEGLKLPLNRVTAKAVLAHGGQARRHDIPSLRRVSLKNAGHCLHSSYPENTQPPSSEHNNSTVCVYSILSLASFSGLGICDTDARPSTVKQTSSLQKETHRMSIKMSSARHSKPRHSYGG